MIEDRRVRGVKFVGNNETGKAIAETCGKYMKKATFELGGDDPFIVLQDANVKAAAAAAYKSRLLANGQAAINAKRFIIQEEVYDEFKERLIEEIETKTLIGDPYSLKTNLGPMGTARALEKLRI
jgi:succinate-semialdehyde dehydrogenase/glutarate-semialdehyde dehydrogenase